MDARHALVTLALLSMTSAQAVPTIAQGPAPEWEEAAPPDRPAGPLRPAASGLEAQAANFSLGQPGTVFRYVQTFGVTEEPFIETNDHFYWVEGIGAVGNAVWIADLLAHRVLKFDASGNFIRKIGKAGVVDFTGTPLARITDVAEDGSGNVWAVDAEASHVVQYDSNGEKVGELGQTWNPGSANDRFENPISIAFDGGGNIYISDSGYWGSGYGNNRVQVFDSSGNHLATIGGGACGTGNTQLCWPRHIAIYGNRLYVADADNHRVQIFNISNPSMPTYTATLGQTGSPGSGNNQFRRPQGVAVDANFIYVADTENHRVQVFDRNTLVHVATIGGSYGTGNNQFKYPTDVAVDASGNIYVADYGNKRVQQFSPSHVYQRTYGTTGDSYVEANDRFYYPEGVAVGPDGSIYIAEGHGHRLVKLNAAGVPQWTVGEAGQPGDDNAHFGYLHDVAVGPDGRIYTVESWGTAPYMPGGNHRVQIFNPDGSYYGGFGGYGSGNYQFDVPTGIAFDRNGNLYVADRNNHRVQIYDRQFAYVATLGVTETPGSDNAHFDKPFDVAVDKDGTIYVADEGNDRVQVFNSNRQYVRTIGGGGTGSAFDRFSGWGPHHLTVDSQGRLYVVDTGNSRVQVFDNFANNNAYLTTIGGARGTQPGRFSNVLGIAIGPDDSVYTSEIHNNHRIQKFAPGVPGWKQVNINGFGERSNRINSLASFGGYLYAGAYNLSGSGAQLWRMDASGNWTAVMTNGFGNSNNVGIDHLLEFNGQLYAGVWNQINTPPYYQDGGEIWRSSDGLNWTRVVSQGFGDPTNGEVMRLGVFNNQIYAGTWSYTTTHGAEIWRSGSGDSGSWTRVVANGFGDPNNSAILTMEEFNGALYVGTYSDTGPGSDGADLWRYNGTTWTPVITDGFGYSGTYAIAALAVFNNHLYAGTGRYDFSTQTYPGGQLWRCSQASGCDEPTDWQVVTADGFGNPDNINITALLAWGSHLYAVAYNFQTGMEVWRTADGTNWEQVGFAGLGDSNNSDPYWDNSMAVHNNRLYIGTTNRANGGEVWKKTVTADFTASPTVGAPGTTVTFTNLAGGDFTSATWDFGDGSSPLTTNAATVQHTYTAPGVYTVSLSVTDGVDTDVKTRSAYIQIAHRLFLPLVARNYNPLLALYDDFNYPGFNGYYNPVKWQFWGDPNYFSAVQQGSVLQITNVPNTPAEVGLNLPLAMPLERTLRQVQRFQARLKLSNGTSGTGATIQVLREVSGSGWWAQCSLNAYDGYPPTFGCDITNYTPGNYAVEYGVSWSSSLSFDTWYTARIDIDPNTAQVCFYLDDNLMGCHVPSQANMLKTATDLIPRLVSWNGRAGATGVRYFDDVYITPAGP